MFDLGDLVPLAVEVRDDQGVLTNATTVSLTITYPDGLTTTLPVVDNPPAVTGRYLVAFKPIVSGRHTIRWVTTGPFASFVDTFDVRDQIPTSIFSLADAKAHLNMSAAITKDDEEVRAMSEAVTRVIERHRSEVLVRRTVVEKNVSGQGTSLMLSSRPVISVTSIVDSLGNAQDMTKWTLDGQNGALRASSGYVNGRYLTVTYTAGYSQIPANYILAAKIILSHLWSTQRIQNVGQQVNLGTRARPEELTLSPEGMGFAIPSRAIELLGGRAGLVV